MSYQYGQTTLTPNAAAKTADEIRTELDNLNRIRAAIQAETAEQAKELALIQASRRRFARRRFIPPPTYAPSPAALAYREQYGHIIASQPEPEHGGPRGLMRAVREAQEHEERKRKGVSSG